MKYGDLNSIVKVVFANGIEEEYTLRQLMNVRRLAAIGYKTEKVVFWGGTVGLGCLLIYLTRKVKERKHKKKLIKEEKKEEA